MADVRLVDLEVFKRYSLAIRQESAPVEEVLAVLESTRRQIESAMAARATERARRAPAPEPPPASFEPPEPPPASFEPPPPPPPPPEEAPAGRPARRRARRAPDGAGGGAGAAVPPAR